MESAASLLTHTLTSKQGFLAASPPNTTQTDLRPTLLPVLFTSDRHPKETLLLSLLTDAGSEVQRGKATHPRSHHSQ